MRKISKDKTFIQISSHRMGTGGHYELPEELLAVLPTDPFEQLDVARRVTCMAISESVSNLEAETGQLRRTLEAKESIIHNLELRIVELEQSLEVGTARLSHALDEQVKLTNEKNSLAATIKRLNRDVAKLDTFKRTLMQSLQEDEEPRKDSENSTQNLPLNSNKDSDAYWSRPQIVDDGSGTISARSNQPRFTPLQSAPDSVSINSSLEGIQKALPLVPNQLSPQVTPTRPSKQHSATVSPLRQSSAGPLLRTSHHATAPNSPPRTTSLPARTPRADGKELFQQARNRLSYEQFSSFLANIKELNAHHQTREETLQKANEIFGSENKDLYMIFEGLLSYHLPH